MQEEKILDCGPRKHVMGGHHILDRVQEVYLGENRFEHIPSVSGKPFCLYL